MEHEFTEASGSASDEAARHMARRYAALAATHPFRHPEPSAAAQTQLRIGTDIQATDAVVASLRRHGDRYLARVFTAHEVTRSGWPHVAVESAAERLTATFAVKEAAIKVLRSGTAIPWTDVEMAWPAGGARHLVLRGTAAVVADAQGVSRWALSFDHAEHWAIAIVTALQSPLEPGTGSG